MSTKLKWDIFGGHSIFQTERSHNIINAHVYASDAVSSQDLIAYTFTE